MKDNVKTKNLPHSILKEAVQVAYGFKNSLSGDSLSGVTGYLFSKKKSGRQLNCGEFVKNIDTNAALALTNKKFDGFVDFANCTIKDLNSGESVKYNFFSKIGVRFFKKSL